MKTAIWTAGLVLFLALTSLAFVFKPLPGSAQRAGARDEAAEPDRRDRLDAMQDDVRATFEVVRSSLARESERVGQQVCQLDTTPIVQLLQGWEVNTTARAEIAEKIRGHLVRWKISRGVEFAIVVSQGGQLIASTDIAEYSERIPTASQRDLFGSFAKPHLGGRDCDVVIDALPTQLVRVRASNASDSEGNAAEQRVDPDAQPATLVVSAVRPLWVRPDAPHSLFIAGSLLSSVVTRFERKGSEGLEAEIDWHVFSVAGTGVSRVYGGARQGNLVRRSLVSELRRESTSELGAFKLVGPQVGRWASIQSRGGEFIGGWGVTVAQPYLEETIKPRVIEAVEPELGALPDSSDIVVIAGILLAGVGLLWLFLALWAKFVRPAPTRRVRRAEPDSRSSRQFVTSAEQTQRSFDRFDASCRYFLHRAQELFDEKLRATGVFSEDLDAKTKKQFQGLADRVDGFSEEFHSSNGEFDRKFEDIEKTLRAFVAVLEDSWREKSVKTVGAATDRVVGDQKAAVDEFRAEVQEAQERGRQLAEEVGALRESDAKLRAQLAESAATEAELRQRLEETHLRGEQAAMQENAAVRRLQSVESSEKRSAREVETLQRRVEDLERAEKKCKELEGRVPQLAAENDEQRSRIAQLAKNLELVEEALRSSESETGEERDRACQLEEEIEQAKQSFEDAKRLFAEQQAEMKARARESANEASGRLEAATAVLEKRAGELTDEVGEVRQELEAARSSEADLEERAGQLALEVDELREKLSSARDSEDGYEKRAGELSEEVNEVRQELYAVSNSEAVLKEERVALENENASLREERESYRQKAVKLEQQNAAIINQIESLKVDHDTAKREVADAHDRLESAQDGDIDPLGGLMGMDDTSIETSDAAQDREDFLRLYEEMDEMRAQLEIEQRGRRELQEERDSLVAQIDHLQNEVRSTKKAARDDSELVAHCAALERTKAELEDRVVTLTKEVGEMRHEINGVHGLQGTLVTGNLPTPLAAVDPSLKVIVWNPAAESFWGVTAAEALGGQLDQVALLSQELRDRIVADVRRRLDDQEPGSTPFLSIERSDGRTKHFRLHYEPVRNVEGQPEGVIVSVEDVTETTDRAIECELQTQFQDTLTASIPLALVVTDPKLRVMSWNPHATDILGVAEDDALGHELFDLALRTDVDEFQREFRTISDGGKAGRFICKPINGAPSGDPIDQLVTVSPFVMDSGEFRGWVLLVEEIVGEVA